MMMVADIILSWDLDKFFCNSVTKMKLRVV